MAERQNWYLFGNGPKDYDYYDLETLKSLSENGDMLARSRYAWHLVGERRLDEARPLYRSLAVHGSTSAATEFSAALLTAYKLSGEADSEMFVEALSWYMFADLRGDISAAIAYDAVPKFHGLKATREDGVAACALARQLMRELSDERAALGLEQFDNTPFPVEGYEAGSLCAALK